IADLTAQVQQARSNVAASLTKEQQARVALDQARNSLQSARTTMKWTDDTTAVAVQNAKAGLETAKQRLEIVKQGARNQERRQAEAQVAVAKTEMVKAQKDRDRYRDLLKQQAVSASQVDQYEAAYDAAAARYESAQQALSLIREGARPEDIRT